MWIMRFLIADPYVNVSIPLTDVLKHSFPSVEHRVQEILSPVKSLLPLILERNIGVNFVGLCLEAMGEGFALEGAGGIDSLNGEFVRPLKRMCRVIGLDCLAGGQRMVFGGLDHIIR